MELGRISATKFKAFAACPARYKAEYLDGGRGGQAPGVPAMTGSAVHKALEDYVQGVYMRRDTEPTLKNLHGFLEACWEDVFGESATSTPDAFKDAKKMLETWHSRTDLSDVEILSTEAKTIRNVEVPGGTREFTYIFDRCESFTDNVTGERVIRVVDYKTFRFSRSFDEIESDLQMRMYAVGAMLDHGSECDRVDVQMDLLRHSNVTVTFYPEEIRQFYVDMFRTAGEILATDADNAPERLSSECMFCVRKSTCRSVRNNIASGGFMSTVTDDTDPADLLTAYAEIEAAYKAAEGAKKELAALIRERCDHEQVSQISGGGVTASLSQTSRRYVDAEKAMDVVDPKVVAAIASVPVGKLEKLHESGKISDGEWAEIEKTAITKRQSEASVRIKKK